MKEIQYQFSLTLFYSIDNTPAGYIDDLLDKFFKLELIEEYKIDLDLMKKSWGDNFHITHPIDYFYEKCIQGQLIFKRKSSSKSINLKFEYLADSKEDLIDLISELTNLLGFTQENVKTFLIKDLLSKKVYHYPEVLPKKKIRKYLIEYRDTQEQISNIYIFPKHYDPLYQYADRVLYKIYYEDGKKDIIPELRAISKHNPKNRQLLHRIQFNGLKIDFCRIYRFNSMKILIETFLYETKEIDI